MANTRITHCMPLRANVPFTKITGAAVWGRLGVRTESRGPRQEEKQETVAGTCLLSAHMEGGIDGNSEMPPTSHYITSAMCDDLRWKGALSAAGRATSAFRKKIRICVQNQSPISSKHLKPQPHCGNS